MKKKLCLLLTLTLALAALTGCGKKPEASAYTASNEIFTYEKIDSAKTQIVVSRTGNIDVAPLCEAFEAANPDVQVLYVDITGGDSNYAPMRDWVKHGCAPDVMFTAAGFFSAEDTARYFEDLSTNTLIERFSADAIQRTAIDGHVYWLPGPSNINAMMYNKTLFAQYGWTLPATFDEFVALCLRIREDTNGEVEPWNPNAKYDMELLRAMEGFTYADLFGGAENRSWYNDFCAGKAAFTGHMEPYYETLQTLAENGLLREEHFSYSATTRGKEFAAGKIAMINMVIYDADNEDYDFGYLPYPTTEGDLGYVCDSYSCLVGVPKKERTEKQKEAVNRLLAYFATVEGQQTYIGKSIKVSNVKDVPLNQADDLAALQPVIEAGHMFAALEFASELGPRKFSLHSGAIGITTGAKTVAECVAEVDEQPYFLNASTKEPEAALGKAEKTMSILETSFYIADAYRERADADIALIANNAVYRGNVMKFFEGEITLSMLGVFKPRSFDNDSTLVKLAMTGKQLLDALNAPPNYDDELTNCIYAYSGLQCEIAPWNALGEKYLSVKLADGSQIDPEKTYTVAAWAGTVSDKYITETLESFEGSFADVLAAKVAADGHIAPYTDGRVTLRWK